MKKLAVALLAVVLVSGVFAQDRNNDRPDLLSLTQDVKPASVSTVPQGQMRGDMHWHTLYSDGYSSVTTSAMWAKRYGAEFLLISDHAHVLGLNRAYLDVFGGIICPWTGKIAVTAEQYLDNVYADGRQTVIPVGPWLEVGEESHFLVFPGSHDNVMGRIGEIVDLGCRTKELGTQTVIERIDQILQQTGGCMIQAHPMNSSYPFNYNFARCQSSVGVEFFNGTKAEHWPTFDCLIQEQVRSMKPCVATAGVDQHIPEGALGELESALTKSPYEAFLASLKGQFDEVVSYRPSKRFTYVFGRSSNATVISSLIRDGHCYAAYGDTVITGMTVQPGQTWCPPRDADTFFVSTRGLPQSVETMKVAFVDDLSHEVSQKEVRWQTQPSGTRLGYFSVDNLRGDRTRSGKLIMATTEFVTSAVSIDPQAIAGQPTAASAPAPQPTVHLPAAVLSPWESFGWVYETVRVGMEIKEYGSDDVHQSRLPIYHDYQNLNWMKIGLNQDGTCRISIRFADRQLIDYQLKMRALVEGTRDFVGPAPQISAKIRPNISIKTGVDPQMTVSCGHFGYHHDGKEYVATDIYLTDTTAEYRNPDNGQVVVVRGIFRLYFY